jgi:hypothetical protein
VALVDALRLGNYHVYRGVLNSVGHGLRDIWSESTQCLVEGLRRCPGKARLARALPDELKDVVDVVLDVLLERKRRLRAFQTSVRAIQ